MAIFSERTVSTLLEWRARTSPQSPAFAVESASGTWDAVSWQEFSARVRHLARAMSSRGLRKGDRLAIIAPVRLEWELLHHAALSIGVIVIGIDAHDAPARLAAMCDLAQVTAYALSGMPSTSTFAKQRLQGARLVIDLDDSLFGLDGNVASWAELSSTEDDGEAPPDRPGADDLATIVFTSGTTGEPKGIAYTHGQLMLALTVIADAFDFVGESGHLLCWLPLSNLFQRMVNLAGLRNGPVSYLLSDPRRVMDVVKSVEPDVFIGVPRFYEKLSSAVQERVAGLPPFSRWIVKRAMRLGRVAADARLSGRVLPLQLQLQAAVADRLVLRRIRAVMGSRLRCMISGSAPTPMAILRDFEALNWPVLEAYGLSENALPMAMNRLRARRIGSVGRPVQGNDIVVARDGSILVRGKGVFSGYLGHTESALDMASFYATGDLGHFDSEGYLWLTGRATDMIKLSTGRKLAPAECEASIRTGSGVEQALLVGDGRKCLVALCTCAGPLDVAARRALESLIEVAMAGISTYARPLAFGILERPFALERGELTANLKLRRAFIIEKHREIVEDLFALAETAATAAETRPRFLWLADREPVAA